jgi:hypothetical protein
MTTRKPARSVIQAKTPPDKSILYRVRDRHADLGDGEQPISGHVWGENLTWDEATILKEQVVGQKKSRTARLEPMSVSLPGQDAQVSDSPDAYRALTGDEVPEEEAAEIDESLEFDLVDVDEHTAPGQGVVVSVPEGHELLVNGHVQPVPVTVNAGDRVQARPVDPQLVASRAAAMAAARTAARLPGTRPVYVDKTVVAQKPRTAPAPRDRTVPKARKAVRLGAPPAVAPPAPPPSPLKVATIRDGDPLPDDALGEDDLHDLGVDGGASDADVAHAKRQRDEQKPDQAGRQA